MADEKSDPIRQILFKDNAKMDLKPPHVGRQDHAPPGAVGIQLTRAPEQVARVEQPRPNPPPRPPSPGMKPSSPGGSGIPPAPRKGPKPPEREAAKPPKPAMQRQEFTSLKQTFSSHAHDQKPKQKI